MKTLKLVSAMTLAALALVLLVSCGAPPVAMADIPTPPNVAPLEKGQNVVADAAIDAMQQSLEGQSFKSDVKLYALPADTQWDAVKSFYTDKLDENWKLSPELSHETEAFSTSGWARGNSQALVVGYGPDPLGGGPPFLMVMLASK
jgi:hypothetical protein